MNEYEADSNMELDDTLRHHNEQIYSPPPTPSSSDNNKFDSNDETEKLEFSLPNDVKSAISLIKKFLVNEKKFGSFEITQNQVLVDKQVVIFNYEECRICKENNFKINCPNCERKVCDTCIDDSNGQCLKCKETAKLKKKVESEKTNISEKINTLLNLTSKDKIRDIVLMDVEKLNEKNLEQLLGLVKKLTLKRDKLDRETTIVYFYIGKIFVEKIKKFYEKEGEKTEEETIKTILSSYRYAKDLDYGYEGKEMTIKNIKETLSFSDPKVSRFFSLCLKIFFLYSIFSEPEVQIRKAEKIFSPLTIREITKERFLDLWKEVKKNFDEKNSRLNE